MATKYTILPLVACTIGIILLYGNGCIAQDTALPVGVFGSCNETIRNGKSGYIASPGYPNSYEDDSYCTYVIEADEGSVITYQTLLLDLEGQSDANECEYDYLQLSDGDDSKLGTSYVKDGRFCGAQTIPLNATTTNTLRIQFISDISTSGRGFVLQWSVVKPSDLRPTFNCNFDGAIPLCPGWRQRIDDSNDWKFSRISTATLNTGPSKDHTDTNKDGRFAYIEASEMKEDDDAVMISPIMASEEGEGYCLTFWYHAYGSGIGRLDVLRLMEDDDVGELLFRSGEGLSNAWYSAEIDLKGNGKNFFIIFRGVCGNSFYSDIAIDDIVMVTGTCDPREDVTGTVGTIPGYFTTGFYGTGIATTGVFSECSEDKFSCADGLECVSKDYVCDGENDCNDGSDEENCSETTDCPESFEWQSCGSACNHTCSDGVDGPPCSLGCVPRCGCHASTPVTHNNRCVAFEDCPPSTPPVPGIEQTKYFTEPTTFWTATTDSLMGTPQIYTTGYLGTASKPHESSEEARTLYGTPTGEEYITTAATEVFTITQTEAVTGAVSHTARATPGSDETTGAEKTDDTRTTEPVVTEWLATSAIYPTGTSEKDTLVYTTAETEADDTTAVTEELGITQAITRNGRLFGPTTAQPYEPTGGTESTAIYETITATRTVEQATYLFYTTDETEPQDSTAVTEEPDITQTVTQKVPDGTTTAVAYETTEAEFMTPSQTTAATRTMEQATVLYTTDETEAEETTAVTEEPDITQTVTQEVPDGTTTAVAYETTEAEFMTPSQTTAATRTVEQATVLYTTDETEAEGTTADTEEPDITQTVTQKVPDGTTTAVAYETTEAGFMTPSQAVAATQTLEQTTVLHTTDETEAEQTTAVTEEPDVIQTATQEVPDGTTTEMAYETTEAEFTTSSQMIAANQTVEQSTVLYTTEKTEADETTVVREKPDITRTVIQEVPDGTTTAVAFETTEAEFTTPSQTTAATQTVEQATVLYTTDETEAELTTAVTEEPDVTQTEAETQGSATIIYPNTTTEIEAASKTAVTEEPPATQAITRSNGLDEVTTDIPYKTTAETEITHETTEARMTTAETSTQETTTEENTPSQFENLQAGGKVTINSDVTESGYYKINYTKLYNFHANMDDYVVRFTLLNLSIVCDDALEFSNYFFGDHIMTVCGTEEDQHSKRLPVIYSESNMMTVVFETNGENESFGFTAEVDTISGSIFPNTGCGGNFYDKNGTISSPNFPSKSNIETCAYYFDIQEHQFAELDFQSFGLGGYSHQCNEDKINIEATGTSYDLCGFYRPEVLRVGGNFTLTLTTLSPQPGFLMSYTMKECTIDGQIFGTDVPSCDASCLNSTVVDCNEIAYESRCYCPKDRPILDSNRCISRDECEAASVSTTLEPRKTTVSKDETTGITHDFKTTEDLLTTRKKETTVDKTTESELSTVASVTTERASNPNETTRITTGSMTNETTFADTTLAEGSGEKETTAIDETTPIVVTTGKVETTQIYTTGSERTTQISNTTLAATTTSYIGGSTQTAVTTAKQETTEIYTTGSEATTQKDGTTLEATATNYYVEETTELYTTGSEATTLIAGTTLEATATTYYVEGTTQTVVATKMPETTELYTTGSEATTQIPGTTPEITPSTAIVGSTVYETTVESSGKEEETTLIDATTQLVVTTGERETTQMYTTEGEATTQIPGTTVVGQTTAYTATSIKGSTYLATTMLEHTTENDFATEFLGTIAVETTSATTDDIDLATKTTKVDADTEKPHCRAVKILSDMACIEISSAYRNNNYTLLIERVNSTLLPFQKAENISAPNLHVYKCFYSLIPDHQYQVTVRKSTSDDSVTVYFTTAKRDLIPKETYRQTAEVKAWRENYYSWRSTFTNWIATFHNFVTEVDAGDPEDLSHACPKQTQRPPCKTDLKVLRDMNNCLLLICDTAPDEDEFTQHDIVGWREEYNMFKDYFMPQWEEMFQKYTSRLEDVDKDA